MNQENLNYLKENLKFTGFADKLNESLETAVKKQEPEFTLKLETEVNKIPVKAELYFKKSTETDMYFFNKYDIELKNEKQQDLSQTFYINQGHGVTLKEAYNLLNGRAVHKELENKEGQKYHAWIKLDFSEKDEKGNFKRQQYHENYGYNLKDTLSKYPIKEMLDVKQTEDLLKSLQKGNAQVVTLEMEGKDQKMFIEANPQFKTINIYDMKMQKVERQSLQQGKDETATAKQEEKQDQKKSLNNKQEDQKGKSKRNNRRKGQSFS